MKYCLCKLSSNISKYGHCTALTEVLPFTQMTNLANLVNQKIMCISITIQIADTCLMTCLITHVDLIISPGCCGSAVDNAQSQPFMDCHALDEEANDCYNNNYNLPRGIITFLHQSLLVSVGETKYNVVLFQSAGARMELSLLLRNFSPGTGGWCPPSPGPPSSSAQPSPWAGAWGC